MYERMAASYDVKYEDGTQEETTINEDGRITMGSDSGNLVRSDNQNQFPSEQGWFLWRYSTWYMYIRVRDDVIEMHRFSSTCNKRYQDLENYCFRVEGTRRAPTDRG